MRVIIYVEGPSDKFAMEMLLADLLEKKRWQGIEIEFYEAPPGDKKESLLKKVPMRAVNILRNDAQAIVAIMPDLYPKDRVFPHKTFEDMESGIFRIFRQVLQQKGITDDQRIVARFKVFCFKHDLEALVLSAMKPLQERLGVSMLRPSWIIPVEEQNHLNPPKKIVEKLFAEHGKKYDQVIDAPVILSKVSYLEIAQQCPECFKPFIEFLEGLPGEEI
jgi:hypothetical protein